MKHGDFSLILRLTGFWDLPKTICIYYDNLFLDILFTSVSFLLEFLRLSEAIFEIIVLTIRNNRLVF
jgi:hypothetical protein